jgi:putative transcriptional regulator
MTTTPAKAEERHSIRIRLAELMARHNVTNEALAEAIGISPNQLSRLKNGDVSFIRLTTLDAICRELKCTPGDLLTRDPD